MKKDAIHWFELQVSDISRAKVFYETALHLPLQSIDGDSAMEIFPYERTSGVGGALVHREGGSPAPGGTMIYLNAEGELDEILVRIPAAGGKVLRERFAIPPNGFIGVFEDTEGNVVGLHSQS